MIISLPLYVKPCFFVDKDTAKLSCIKDMLSYITWLLQYKIGFNYQTHIEVNFRSKISIFAKLYR